MKWGDRYDYNYVNNLYSSIKTHTKIPTKLICFTDNNENIVNFFNNNSTFKLMYHLNLLLL